MKGESTVGMLKRIAAIHEMATENVLYNNEQWANVDENCDPNEYDYWQDSYHKAYDNWLVSQRALDIATETLATVGLRVLFAEDDRGVIIPSSVNVILDGSVR